jgi:hypothetical protein
LARSEKSKAADELMRKEEEHRSLVTNLRAKADDQLRRKEEEHRTLILKLRTKAARLARMISWGFFGLITCILVVGPLAVGVLATPSGTGIGRWMGYIITGAVWLAGVLGLLWGGCVEQWRVNIETRVFRSLRKWLSVDEEAT